MDDAQYHSWLTWLMGDAYGSPGPDLPDGPDWFADAACADVDPAVFFPEGRGASPNRALQVCHACPVREQCARYADAHGFDLGVWGGLTARQRAERQHVLA